MSCDSKVVGMGSPLAGLATLRNCRSKRVSSFDQTGGNADRIIIKPWKKAVLADIKGSGAVRHIWFTVNHEDNRFYLRSMVLRMYWDGEKTPSVEVPLGDFFGVGHSRTNHFVSLPLTMTGGKGNHAGFNCYFPMPFSKRARIEVENESEGACLAFYYYIDYEEYDELPEDQACFHAHWRGECPCKAQKATINLDGKHNYLILDAKGRGHYVGTLLNVHNFGGSWFGEGDDMFFVDGEKWPPSLHGTGTEDYFCCAWGFPSGYYAGPYTGVSLAGLADNHDWAGRWSLYRFHIEDPVHFTRSLRVSIEHGHANDRGDDYSSVAYWYQTEPHKPFPKFPSRKKRLPVENYAIRPK